MIAAGYKCKAKRVIGCSSALQVTHRNRNVVKPDSYLSMCRWRQQYRREPRHIGSVNPTQPIAFLSLLNILLVVYFGWIRLTLDFIQTILRRAFRTNRSIIPCWHSVAQHLARMRRPLGQGSLPRHSRGVSRSLYHDQFQLGINKDHLSVSASSAKRRCSPGNSQN